MRFCLQWNCRGGGGRKRWQTLQSFSHANTLLLSKVRAKLNAPPPSSSLKVFFVLKYNRLEKASVIQKLSKITTRASIPLTFEGKSWVSAQSPLCHGQRRAFFLFLNKSFCSMQLTNCPSVARQEEEERRRRRPMEGKKLSSCRGGNSPTFFCKGQMGYFSFLFYFSWTAAAAGFSALFFSAEVATPLFFLSPNFKS